MFPVDEICQLLVAETFIFGNEFEGRPHAVGDGASHVGGVSPAVRPGGLCSKAGELCCTVDQAGCELLVGFGGAGCKRVQQAQQGIGDGAFAVAGRQLRSRAGGAGAEFAEEGAISSREQGGAQVGGFVCHVYGNELHEHFALRFLPETGRALDIARQVQLVLRVPAAVGAAHIADITYADHPGGAQVCPLAVQRRRRGGHAQFAVGAAYLNAPFGRGEQGVHGLLSPGVPGTAVRAVQLYGVGEAEATVLLPVRQGELGAEVLNFLHIVGGERGAQSQGHSAEQPQGHDNQRALVPFFHTRHFI